MSVAKRVKKAASQKKATLNKKVLFSSPSVCVCVCACVCVCVCV